MQHLRQGTTRTDENHVRVRKLKDGSLTGLLVQALEGKDVKDLLVNVGSGGGAAAPAAGGAAAAGGDAAAPAAEEKEEGASNSSSPIIAAPMDANTRRREGGVRRGHGLRSLRLSTYAATTVFLLPCTSTAWLRGSRSIDHTGWRRHDISWGPGQSSFVNTMNALKTTEFSPGVENWSVYTALEHKKRNVTMQTPRPANWFK